MKHRLFVATTIAAAAITCASRIVSSRLTTMVPTIGDSAMQPMVVSAMAPPCEMAALLCQRQYQLLMPK